MLAITELLAAFLGTSGRVLTHSVGETRLLCTHHLLQATGLVGKTTAVVELTVRSAEGLALKHLTTEAIGTPHQSTWRNCRTRVLLWLNLIQFNSNHTFILPILSM